MRQLREARKRSQEEVAKQLHIKQAAVSKLERRTDMYLSKFAGSSRRWGASLKSLPAFPISPCVLRSSRCLTPSGGHGGL